MQKNPHTADIEWFIGDKIRNSNGSSFISDRRGGFKLGTEVQQKSIRENGEWLLQKKRNNYSDQKCKNVKIEQDVGNLGSNWRDSIFIRNISNMFQLATSGGRVIREKRRDYNHKRLITRQRESSNYRTFHWKLKKQHQQYNHIGSVAVTSVMFLNQVHQKNET